MSVVPSPDPSSEQLVLQAPRVSPAWKREAGLPSPRRWSSRGSRVSVGPGQRRALVSAAHPAPCCAQEPAMAPIFPVARRVKPSAGGALPGVGAKAPGLTRLLCRMKRAVSLNMLHVDGARATGTQVRGRRASGSRRGLEGAQLTGPEGRVGTVRLARAPGWSGPTDRRTGGEQYSHRDGRAGSQPAGVALVAAGAGLSCTLPIF